jgi:serine/threonine protein kinase
MAPRKGPRRKIVGKTGPRAVTFKTTADANPVAAAKSKGEARAEAALKAESAKREIAKKRLAAITERARLKFGLQTMDWKHDVELMIAQQTPTRNPSFVAPPPIPEGFEPNMPHHVRVLKNLNAGAQGAVVLADVSSQPIFRGLSGNSTKQLHAIKIIQNYEEVVAKRNAREVEALLHLRERHPNVVQLEAFASTAGHQLMYYMYSDADSLNSLIQGFQIKHQIIPEAFIWHVAAQLVKAVNFIQNPPPCERCRRGPMIHVDIKPENIFLTWPDKKNHNVYPTVQLGDFGLALVLTKGNTQMKLNEFTGTVPFAAPEQIKQFIYSKKTDIWGIGAVLHSMIHGIPPIQEPMVKTRSQTRRYQEALLADNQRDTEERTAEALGLERRMNYSWRSNHAIPRVAKECPPDRSKYLGALLKGTLRDNPDDRPTIETLLKEVLEYEEKIRELTHSPLPTWFQLASRNALAETQKQFVKPVPATPLGDPMDITHG